MPQYQYPGVYAIIQWQKGTRVKVVPRKDGNFSTSLFLGHVGVIIKDVWSSQDTAEVHLEDWGGSPESYVVVPVFELEEVKTGNPYGVSSSDIYGTPLFEPGDIVRIVRHETSLGYSIPAGDCLGKCGTVIDRAWSNSSEVLVQLEGEANYRAFCLENVWVIKPVERRKQEDDITGTPFKFGMYEAVIIRSSGHMGTISGRFAKRQENGSFDVIYELVGPSINGQYKEEELMPKFEPKNEFKNFADAYLGGGKITIGEVQNQSKPGVYISEIGDKVEPIKVSSMDTYNFATNSQQFGNPVETFKIGDRVRVVGSTKTQLSLKDRGLSKLLNQFGVVRYIDHSDDIVQSIRLAFDNFDESLGYTWNMYPEDLKIEFCAGDRVRNWEGDACVVDRYDGNCYWLTRWDGMKCACADVDMLTYLPDKDKEKKNAVEPGTISVNGEVVGRVKDWSFVVNPKDLYSSNEIGTLKKTIKEILTESKDKRSNTMNTLSKNIYGVPTTYSATIVLANGETVNIPDPDSKCWELKRTTKFDEVYPCFIDSEDRLRISCFDSVFFAELLDEQARCWAKDMARIVNEEVDQGPFEKYFSYVTEIREYIRKPIEQEEVYPCCFSTLRNLW